MSYDTDHGGRAIPTLVQYCQRVVSANVNKFDRLGGGLREEIILPILNGCTAETLWRFEDEDPYLVEYTSDIWKNLCHKQHPLLVRDLEDSGSETWKEEFARCEEEHASKLEQVAAKLREKRHETEEKRKASSIKITDKLPPAKRARWGVSAPKTLFQKTRTEAVKLQKGVFSTRMMRPSFQRRALVSNSASARPPSVSASTSTLPAASGSRVTVRAVAVPRKPLETVRAPSAASTATGPSKTAAAVYSSMDAPPAAVADGRSPPPPSYPPDSRSPPPPRPGGKKDPASTLFMPKHRAYSQLQARGVRSKS
ncbi:hypothetical protein C8Q77DRAFT_1092523 [Trametes polyzona]|nr:hypothetical protein C8Q77DRAFT_1092523 [Trametes polyzona]